MSAHAPFSVHVAHSCAEVMTARKLEYDVFRGLNYCPESDGGVIDEYDKYIPQSRFYVMHEGPEAVGVLRHLSQGALGLPVFTEFETHRSQDLVSSPQVAEVGVVAIRQANWSESAARHLYRAAWQDAKRSGITHWAAVIEDWLLRMFRDRYHFMFEPCGPARHYMGGDCIPCIMSFEEVEWCMSRDDPALLDWFSAGLPASMLNVFERSSPSLAV